MLCKYVHTIFDRKCFFAIYEFILNEPIARIYLAVNSIISSLIQLNSLRNMSCFCAMVVDCLKPALTHSLSVKLSLNCCSSVLKITSRGIAKLLHANN